MSGMAELSSLVARLEAVAVKLEGLDFIMYFILYFYSSRQATPKDNLVCPSVCLAIWKNKQNKTKHIGPRSEGEVLQILDKLSMEWI